MGEIALFCGFGLFFYIIPGYLLLSAFHKELSLWETFLLSVAVGMCLFILTTLIILTLSLPISLIYVYAVMALVLTIKKSQMFQQTFRQVYWKKFFLVGAVIFSLSALLVWEHIHSGYFSGNLRLAAARDTFWRMSVIGELTHAFPPQHPGYPPQPLKNYHFLYDLLIATAQKLTRIDAVILYSHLFAPLSALIFVGMVYVVLNLLVRKTWLAISGTILTIFAGNLSYLLPFISKEYQFVAKPNIFMSDQPFDQSNNPFNYLSYGLFLVIFYLLIKWDKHRSWQRFLPLLLVFGILPGIKIYAGALALGGWIVYLILAAIRQKRISIYTLLPFGLVYPIVNLMKGSDFSILAYSPGWLFQKMIEDSDRLFLPQVALKQQYYTATGNVFRLGLMQIELLYLYFVGNLNFRLIALLFWLRRLWRRYLTSQVLVYTTAVIIAAFFIPLLFNQRRAPYDSIQFTPYGLLMTSLVSILVIDRAIVKARSSWRRLVIFLLFSLTIVLAVPTNIYLLAQKMNLQEIVVSRSEIEALKFLESRSVNTDIILSDLDGNKLDNMYVPALSQRRTYLSGASLVEQTGVSTRQRQAEIASFFRAPDVYSFSYTDLYDRINFLHSHAIAYVYLSGSGLRHEPLMKILGLPLVYENREVLIYETKQL